MPYQNYASGTLDMLSGSGGDLTDPMLQVVVIHTDGDLTEEDEKELREYYNYGNCGCAHDCCGHRHGGVSSITKVWDGRYVVLISSERNY